MLAPRQIQCQRIKRNRREMAWSPLAPCFLLPAFSELALGFATPRRLGKHPQRVRCLGAAFLLKLGDPVSHGPNHVARRFTSGSCFCFNNGTGFLALLD